MRRLVNTACVVGIQAVLLALATFAFDLQKPAHGAAPVAVMSACATEDSTSCVWDARHMGNGNGRSFIALCTEGHTIHITHRQAHRLLARP